MELADVKVGETYLFTSQTGDPDSGKTVTVVSIDAPELDLPWPVEAVINDEHENTGAFWASELSPVV